MSEVLTADTHHEVIASLSNAGWVFEEDQSRLEKTFSFETFADAMGWMTRVAVWVVQWDHHPSWSNVLGEVKVALTTHDEGGVTDLDVKLAKKMDSLF
jgi:4a-hydroxytetrahydrobiopterin dehydratase